VNKLNLQEAAVKVGIPKKTLEDYYAIFRYNNLIIYITQRKLKDMGADLNTFSEDKMGTLRHLLRQCKD